MKRSRHSAGFTSGKTPLQEIRDAIALYIMGIEQEKGPKGRQEKRRATGAA